MTFTLIFILGLVLSTATRFYLAGRHIKHIAKHRDQVPSDFANKVSLVEHHKAADYTMAKLRLGLFEIGLSAAILIAFTLLGGIQIIHNASLELLGPGIPQQIALLVLISVITGIIDLPFSLYRQFGIEEQFGFNRMTAKLYIMDSIKGILLGLAIGLPLLWVVLSLMTEAGQNVRTTCPGCSMVVLAPPGQYVQCPQCLQKFNSPTWAQRTSEIGRNIRGDLEEARKPQPSPGAERAPSGPAERHSGA
jgi:hypothetical protein